MSLKTSRISSPISLWLQFTRTDIIIKGILENPPDVSNSIGSANQIRDILTDNIQGNSIVIDISNRKYDG